MVLLYLYVVGKDSPEPTNKRGEFQIRRRIESAQIRSNELGDAGLVTNAIPTSSFDDLLIYTERELLLRRHGPSYT
jgi:hypothetical protein